MCTSCSMTKKKKAKMRGIDASGFIAPLALGSGVYFGKKGADYATAKVDFLDANPLYSGVGKVIGGAVGFNAVSRLINSVVPIPFVGEGLMGGILYSGIEDTMYALDPVNKDKKRSDGMKGVETDYDWERLYNQQQVEAESGRL